jgi:hypothetical protein
MRRDWRKLHNEELHKLYSSSNIITMIKSRRKTRKHNVSEIGSVPVLR